VLVGSKSIARCPSQAEDSSTRLCLFEVGGLPIARDTAAIDLGVDFTVTRNVSARVSYAGQIGSQYQQHAIQGRVSWAF
jgi:outer membrane autotransporter protein